MIRGRHCSISGKGRHHEIRTRLIGTGSSPLLKLDPSNLPTVGNTRSVLGGCSSGGLGCVVWPWCAVGHRLLSARMWISMLQNMPQKQRH